MQDTIAVDLAKNVFQVAESRRPGKVHRERRLTRSQFQLFIAEHAPARFLFEACGSANYWAQQVQAKGHTPVVLPPHLTRRYRGSSKTDRVDAKALREAARNEEIRPVPVKTPDQQALASLHRLRFGYIITRTARTNMIRGLLREFGFVIPIGTSKVVPFVHALEAGSLPAPIHRMLLKAAEDVVLVQERIAAIERELQGVLDQSPLAQWLTTVPGIGLITATALVAFVGDFRRFPTARHFASSLGLTPRESSSGERRYLGRITKRGDAYLRTLLIHGARSVLAWARRSSNPTPLQQWMLQVQARRTRNIAAVAVANKMARFAWVVANQQRKFRPSA